MNKLYTIGYAGKNFEDFINLLIKNNINCLVDVRSTPKSKTFPMYDFSNLKKELKKYNIKYGSMKECFGARRIENEVYKKIILYNNDYIEVVDFEKVHLLDVFNDGFKRIVQGSLNNNICFMCSEKNPFDCHRAIMVAEYFYQKGYEIIHIIDENTKINHANLDKELKNNFEESKKKFRKTYEDELNYSGNLFTENKPLSSNIEYWVEFFSNYTREKGIKLRNYQIGFKKGNEEND